MKAYKFSQITIFYNYASPTEAGFIFCLQVLVLQQLPFPRCKVYQLFCSLSYQTKRRK
jgi:hypothetical protein